MKAATKRGRRSGGKRRSVCTGKALKLKPSYVEGHWYQGTAYYTLDDFTRCREAFRSVVRLAPKNGAVYAFLGLCEFGLKDYERSLQHLLQSRILGVGDTQDLGNIARYHAAILMTRMEQYEQALETLGEFAGGGNDNPRVIEAMGLATLRMALLPSEAPPDRREMVLMAGRASYMMATRNTASAAAAFETLASRYPETPNVHYVYGVFLLQEQPDRALEEFTRELELQPGILPRCCRLLTRTRTAAKRRPRCHGRRRHWPPHPTRSPRTRRSGRRCSRPAMWTAPSGSCRPASSSRPTARACTSTSRAPTSARGAWRNCSRARGVHALDRLARTLRTGAQSVGGR